MTQFNIIAVGKRLPKWADDAFNMYKTRFPKKEYSVNLREIPIGKRAKNSSVEKAMLQEEENILNALPKDNSVTIALDVKGKSWTTEKLAKNLSQWQIEYKNINFIIGGPDGLTQKCLSICDMRWSLSALTFPHTFIRMMLIEQLYRSWTILNNHPYHRAD